MKLLYAYAGFSLGVTIYLLYLVVAGLRTPDLSTRFNLFDVVVAAFVIFTLYVLYKLTRTRT